MEVFLIDAMAPSDNWKIIPLRELEIILLRKLEVFVDEVHVPLRELEDYFPERIRSFHNEVHNFMFS